MHLKQEFKSLSSSCSFPTLSSNTTTTNQFHSIHQFDKMFEGILYSRSLLLISSWLGVSNGNVLYISIARSCQRLSQFSLTLKRVISIFKSNQIILEMSESIQKTHKNSAPLKPLLIQNLYYSGFSRGGEKTEGCIHVYTMIYFCYYKPLTHLSPQIF